jgi:hypothetical protein
LSGLSLLDLTPPQAHGKIPSHWVVLARDSAGYGSLANDAYAKPLVSSGSPVWTDDFSNIISVFRPRRTETY